MRDPDITLSAGPTMAYPEVLAAQGKQITYHYDPAFIELFRRTERKVGELLLTQNDVLLMQGEAVLGLEAAGRGLVHPGTPVLNLVSGVFGKGMGFWLKDFGAELHELEVPYNDSVDPADVERYLDEHPEIEVLTVVHSETPSGTLHDVAAIGTMAHSRGVLTIVDCVSSARRHRVPHGRLADRHRGRGGAEVPGRPSGHHADVGERRGLGADTEQSQRAACVLPLHARLEGAVDRRREVSVHALRRRHARHRRLL